MWVSTETIYQSLYVQSRGALRRELTRALRTGRAMRIPNRPSARRKNRVLPDMVNVSARPVEATDQAVAGHCEGDLIIAKAQRLRDRHPSCAGSAYRLAMTRNRVRRLTAAAFVGFMGLLVLDLTVILGRSRGYFCAAVVVALTLCLLAVRPGRHKFYASGVLFGLATLTLALWPVDPPDGGGGMCGSVLNRHKPSLGEAREILSLGRVGEYSADPVAYLQSCDSRRDMHDKLVAVGGVLTVSLIGWSVLPDRTKRTDETDEPRQEALTPWS